MRLQDKVAIVTGAARGIGKASAMRFAEEGAIVVAADILELDDETISAGSDSPGQIVGRRADVSQANDVQQLVRDTAERFGRIDIIFSNAAILRGGSVVDLPEADWDRLFEVNVKGAFLMGKFGVPIISNGGGGSFIATASANSFYAESDIAGYCATKGAVLQLVRAMAIDHGPQCIRVNCICPGWIETDMSKPFLDENPAGRQFAGKIAPLGRIGQPRDVADVALFLASDESRFVTGSAYFVDGGWTAGMTKAIALI
jgi:dihydroanticapsin dehydrogenase